jgi:ubiquinone/menaquinone biosynthesis C-methylase UbiE
MPDDAPYMSDFYERFYAALPASPAYAELCRRAFGRDLGQHGFASMAQLDALIDASGLGPGQTGLDLGCGDGRITEYIADCTGAAITGLDFSATAIAHARARSCRGEMTAALPLRFVTGDMAGVGSLFPPRSFDAVIAIDTLYFVPLDETLRQAASLVRPGGRIVILYSHGADPSCPIAVFPRETLSPDKTPVAISLHKLDLPYRALDFTADDGRVALVMKQGVTELRAVFESEGHLFLYESRMGEATGITAAHEAGCQSRYLYEITVP